MINFVEEVAVFFFHLEALNDLPLGKSQVGFQLKLDENDSSQLGTILACSLLSPEICGHFWALRFGVEEVRGDEVGWGQANL